MKELYRQWIICRYANYTHVENSGSYDVEHVGNNKLILLFEKSNGAEDWLSNFNFPAKPYRRMSNMWFCHRGFLKVWKSIEPYIADKIKDPAVEQIEIVGYSHGGAIAQLCYEYVKYNRPDVEVTGVGFGSPRVVWGFANKKVKARFEGFKVIRNGRDLVTHLPPVFLGFRHICEVVKIGESEGLIKDHFPANYRSAVVEYYERSEL